MFVRSHLIEAGLGSRKKDTWLEEQRERGLGTGPARRIKERGNCRGIESTRETGFLFEESFSPGGHSSSVTDAFVCWKRLPKLTF